MLAALTLFRKPVWAVALFGLLACGCWAGFLLSGYRTTENLGFVLVKRASSTPVLPHDCEVYAVSPWDTKTELEHDGFGVWRIPRGGKCFVSRFIVVGDITESVAKEAWKISVSPTAVPSWKPAVVSPESGATTLTLEESHLAGSWLENRHYVLNWLGDARLLRRATHAVLAVLTVIGLAIRLLWHSRGRWLRCVGFIFPRAAKRAESSPVFPGRTDRGILWGVLVVGLLTGILGCWSMSRTLWPGLHDDAVLYSTVIINRARGAGNTFEVYTPALLRHQGRRDFASHGQLYFGISAALIPEPDYRSLLSGLHRSNLAAFLVAFSAFLVTIRRTLRTSWLCAGLYALPGAFATASCLLYLQGRPEHGIPFVVLAFVLFRQSCWRGALLPNWASGAQIGLVAAISPLPGALLGLASVVTLGFRTDRTQDYFVGCLIQGATACLVWAAATSLFYDGSIILLVANSLSSGPQRYGGLNLAAFPDFWFHASLVPAIGGVFLLGFGAATRCCFSRISKKGALLSKLLIVIFIMPLLYLIWVQGVAYAGFHYSLIGFLPLVAIWTLETLSSSGQTSRHPFNRWCRPLAAPALVIALSLTGTGFLKAVVLQPSVAHLGVPYEIAKSQVDRWRRTLKDRQMVMIDGYANARSAVVLDEPPWTFRSLPSEGTIEAAEATLGFFARYYLVLQRGDEPREVPGFTLIEDAYVRTPVYFGRCLLNSYTPGYGYALYERDKTAPD